MTEWISVSDKLPEQFDEVIVTDGRYVTHGFYQDDSFVGLDRHLTEISHWMYMPNPPEME